MQGFWSMAFRGRKSDIQKLMAAVEEHAESYPLVWSQWQDGKRFSKDFDALPDNERIRLIIDEGDEGDLQVVADTFQALCKLVPVLDGAVYTYGTSSSKERSYTYCAPGGGRTVQFTAMSNWANFEAEEEDFDELEVVMDRDGVEWRVPKRHAALMEIFMI